MKKIIIYPFLAVLTPVAVFVATVLIKAIANTYDIKITPKDESTINHGKKPVIIDKIGEAGKKSVEKIKPLIRKITKKLKPKVKVHSSLN